MLQFQYIMNKYHLQIKKKMQVSMMKTAITLYCVRIMSSEEHKMNASGHLNVKLFIERQGLFHLLTTNIAAPMHKNKTFYLQTKNKMLNLMINIAAIFS